MDSEEDCTNRFHFAVAGTTLSHRHARTLDASVPIINSPRVRAQYPALLGGAPISAFKGAQPTKSACISYVISERLLAVLIIREAAHLMSGTECVLQSSDCSCIAYQLSSRELAMTIADFGVMLLKLISSS